MLNSKLIDCLKTFSPKQIKWFDEFLCSPYFNKNDDLVKLYRFIVKYAPKFSNPDLDKNTVYCKTFNTKKADEKKLSYLMSDMLNLLEKFIVIQRMENQPLRNNQQVMLQYIETDLEKHF